MPNPFTLPTPNPASVAYGAAGAKASSSGWIFIDIVAMLAFSPNQSTGGSPIGKWFTLIFRHYFGLQAGFYVHHFPRS